MSPLDEWRRVDLRKSAALAVLVVIAWLLLGAWFVHRIAT